MSKSRKIEKNELIKIVKDISRRMDDFSDSVQQLKDLKDSLGEVDEELSERERINIIKLEQLNKELQENKIRAVSKAVEELGKVLINSEELTELKNNLIKLKTETTVEFEEYKNMIVSEYDHKLKQAVQVQQLEHDCQTATLKAQTAMFKSECDNLRSTIQRMSDELASQKQLTAEVAGMNRPRETKPV